jgi:AraC-like DNA-binding protein/TolB-like protein/tetratricopeptide (TPR) repeat protein
MTEPFTRDQIFVSKLTETVLQNLKNENFGVTELAGELNMSPYRLNRKLYFITGKRVNQFIRQIRLRKALELLQNEDTTASEVAYNTGFSSPAYFNKCFREYFGYPPGKVIRKENSNLNLDIHPDKTKESISLKKGPKVYLFGYPGFLIPVIIFIIIGFLVFKKIQLAEPVLKDKRITIAVLPFHNTTNDTLWNVWEEGIQESLISWLSNSNELRIIRKETIHTLLKTQTIRNYASATSDIAGKLSNNLDVNIYINGSIRKAGTRVKLNAEIIDPKTEEVLKSFEITAPASGDIDFEIVDSLRKKVTDYLLISELITHNPWLKNLPRVSTNSPEALKYYIYGYRAYYKADWITARNWFLKALSVDSNYFDAMSRVYYTYNNQGLMDQGLPWLIKLHEKSDEMPALNRLYSNWAYAVIFEAPEVRIKYLQQLQEIDAPENYYYLIGAMYVGAKQFKKAIPDYEKYLKVSRKRGKDFLKDNWVYPALGEVYHLTGQYRKAGRLYREAWKVNTDHGSVYFSWIIRDCASLALSEGDTTAANRYIKEFISVRKENSSSEADISLELGHMYWLAEKWTEGEHYYRKALSLDPGNPGRMNLLANKLIERNRNFDEVTELMNKALERASTQYDYYNYLDTKGYGLYKQGKNKEALAILQKAWNETPFKVYSLKSHLEQVQKTIVTQVKDPLAEKHNLF